MPKRKSKSKNRADQKRSKHEDDDSSNPIAEVFIKSSNSSPCESSSSESDSSSSSDDSYYRRKRASKKQKKSKDGNSKKSLRKLQNQIDLFQRNVDIKLNYLESLIQTLIKGRGDEPSTSAQTANLLCSPNSVMSKSKVVAKQGFIKALAPDFAISTPPAKLQSTEVKKVQLKGSSSKLEIPDFPITGELKMVLKLKQNLKVQFSSRQRVH